MPVVIPNGIEELWTENVKNVVELKGLIPIMTGWAPDDWIAEEVIKPPTIQMRLFK